MQIIVRDYYTLNNVLFFVTLQMQIIVRDYYTLNNVLFFVTFLWIC